MLPKGRISCEHQEVKEAESSRRPLQIIGTVGERLIKAHEGGEKKAFALSYVQGLERGSEEAREMVLVEERPRGKKKKKPLKMNHGKVTIKGRTARVGVRTSSFPLERSKTWQLTARFGE